MTQELNIHLGFCGRCNGNVTRAGNALPRCEHCGATPVAGPVLPMVGPGEAPEIYDPPPLVRDDKGRFRRGG